MFARSFDDVSLRVNIYCLFRLFNIFLFSLLLYVLFFSIVFVICLLLNLYMHIIFVWMGLVGVLGVYFSKIWNIELLSFPPHNRINAQCTATEHITLFTKLGAHAVNVNIYINTLYTLHNILNLPFSFKILLNMNSLQQLAVVIPIRLNLSQACIISYGIYFNDAHL